MQEMEMMWICQEIPADHGRFGSIVVVDVRLILFPPGLKNNK